MPSFDFENVRTKYTALRDLASALALRKQQSPTEAVAPGNDFQTALEAITSLQVFVDAYNASVDQANTRIDEQKTANRLRILYWNPDVPNQPYAMAGLRTAVCDPSVDPAVFTEDTPCAGDLVTEESLQVWNRGHYGPSFLWYNPLPTSVEGRPFTWRYAMYFIASTGGNDSLGLACSGDTLEWKLVGNGPILSGLIDPQPWEGANGYVSAVHVEQLPDGRWWMLYSGGSAGNAGIGYAWSWDRVHWRKSEINPVFKNGSGPFLERCYTPSLVRDADGSLLLYRAANRITLTAKALVLFLNSSAFMEAAYDIFIQSSIRNPQSAIVAALPLRHPEARFLLAARESTRLNSVKTVG